MSSILPTLLMTLAVIMGIMIGLWVIGTVRRDASIVDPFWGTGFVLTTWLALSLNPPVLPRPLLLAILTTTWGLRLSLFLLWRNWGHGEDRRYAAMRKHHGPRFWWISLMTVFLMQGLILWFVSIPLQAAMACRSASPIGGLDAIGAALWMVGFLFETIGDWQLARFRSNPGNAGKIMDRGLWSYTRHPNYFGDFCVWWGLYVIAAAGGAGWTFLSPLLMSILLMKVSGVTLLESTITERRPDYSAYRSRTNSFFPGQSKSKS